MPKEGEVVPLNFSKGRNKKPQKHRLKRVGVTITIDPEIFNKINEENTDGKSFSTILEKYTRIGLQTEGKL